LEKSWKQRIADTRRQQETMREQGEKGVVDILMAAHGDKLTESVSLIDRYMRQNLMTLAMDEAHRAVEFSPSYLPVHIRMAEIMMKEGRVRQAIAKYNTIARAFLARDENDRASQILTSVLELAPLDVSVRESLIELMESESRDEALDQYIDLADAHHQLGNFDMSRDTYMLAERIANRVNASPKLVRIKPGSPILTRCGWICGARPKPKRSSSLRRRMNGHTGCWSISTTGRVIRWKRSGGWTGY
jgi:tetratricopeptide (TPR) repeat protein